MKLHPAIVTVFAAFLLFAAHRALKAQHHRHCTGDLLRVVLFSQSSMCSHIDGILKVIELATDQSTKLLTTYAIEFLTGVLKMSSSSPGATGVW